MCVSIQKHSNRKYKHDIQQFLTNHVVAPAQRRHNAL